VNGFSSLQNSFKVRMPVDSSAVRRLAAGPACCAWLLLALGGAVGCGKPGAAATAPAGGVVLFNGEPATDVRVIFTPENGRPAIGQTDEQGRFVLTTFQRDDGAVPGKHKATISDRKRNWLPDPKTNKVEPGRFPESYQRASTSPWTFEVKSGEDNFFTLDMKS
jgi:hypothetical protein